MNRSQNQERNVWPVLILGAGGVALLVALLYGASDEKIAGFAAMSALFLGGMGIVRLWRIRPEELLCVDRGSSGDEYTLLQGDALTIEKERSISTGNATGADRRADSP